MKKALKIGLRVLIMLVLIATTTFGVLFALSDKVAAFDLNEQLSFGQKYLDDHDYENAVMTYDKILEVDPRNIEAYIGLADAYLGMDDEDKAMDILETGYEKTRDCQLKRKLTEIQKDNE